MAMSSDDGVGSPEGWLWTHMIAAAELRQAVMNTERIWTIDWLRLPIADYSP